MENHFNCVYMYTNKVNGKKYVGQAVDFNKRHKSHIHQSYNENHIAYNAPFHRAIRKYGIENFEVKILKENLQTQCLLNFYESYYIDKFNSLAKDNGYNISSGGSNGNPYAGKTDEEMKECRKRMSEAQKGLQAGEKNPMYGKHFSEESKQKMRETFLSHYKKENNPMYGVHRYGLEAPGLGQLVTRYDLNMQLIDIKYNFEYGKIGFNKGKISECCKGIRKKHKGFIFKYLSDVPDDVINNYIIKTKQIPITN